MESPSTNPKKPSQKSSRSSRDGWVSVSNGVEFSLVRRSELAQAASNGFYRPDDRGKTVIVKDGQLYEVDSDLRESAVASGFTDLVAREKKRTKPSPESTSRDELPQNKALQTKAPQTKTPSLDDLLPGGVASPTVAAIPAAKVSVTPPEPDPLLLVAQAVEQAERDAEQQLIDREEEINSLVGWRQYQRRFMYWLGDRQDVLVKRIGSNSISIALHLVILMILSCLFLVNEKKDGFMIVASPDSEELFVDEMQIETEPMEPSEPTPSEPAEPTPIEDVSMEVTEMGVTPNFLASVKGDAIKMPTPTAKPTFFSSSLTAKSFVFVIDNSNSMTRGRFETALLQLMLTVDQLTPQQRFYVIFFSDTAYGMMHPKTLKKLVPATTQTKLNLKRWLETVPLCLKTNGKEAIQKAFDFNPEVIYVLGDGAFTDKAAQQFINKPHPSIVLHTRGMEVKPSLAKEFEQLATKHRGTYKDVGVMPEGLRLSKQYPRPRNNKRGKVWGITLPLP